ncbi:hypothetical protein KAR91_77080, partial [Candidatus Pacearchaeota archaeon]|nr:hypothetical protein [Candidatus Pacearchaeota archaeon]
MNNTFYSLGDGGDLDYTTITDPAINAAVSTANIDAYAGVVITVTTAGNSQTLQNPTDTTPGKEFVVANAVASTNSITVNGVIFSPGEAQKYIWDGSAWTIVTGIESSTTIFFENFDLRFFGELGLPDFQTWTITTTGSALVLMAGDIVFGEIKNVVKIYDNFVNGLASIGKSLSLSLWEDIRDFGASYGGVSRLDTLNGDQGFFSGLQADAAENPLGTGNRRYGVYFEFDGGYLKIVEAQNTSNNMLFDGLDGRDLILFDEWFKWEAVIPINFGTAPVFINGKESISIDFLT